MSFKTHERVAGKDKYSKTTGTWPRKHIYWFVYNLGLDLIDTYRPLLHPKYDPFGSYLAMYLPQNVNPPMPQSKVAYLPGSLPLIKNSFG